MFFSAWELVFASMYFKTIDILKQHETEDSSTDSLIDDRASSFLWRSLSSYMQ